MSCCRTRWSVRASRVTALGRVGFDPGSIAIAFENSSGIYVGVMNNGFSKQDFQASLVAARRRTPRAQPATRVENACATGSAALYAALGFVEAGRGRVALVVGAAKMTGHGDRSEELARIAAKNRRNGVANPFCSYAQGFRIRVMQRIGHSTAVLLAVILELTPRNQSLSN